MPPPRIGIRRELDLRRWSGRRLDRRLPDICRVGSGCAQYRGYGNLPEFFDQFPGAFLLLPGRGRQHILDFVNAPDVATEIKLA